MFKKKNHPYNTNRKWKGMVIDGIRGKRHRTLRFVEANNGTRVFVERIKDYGRLYIVSRGTNPGAVEVFAVAGDLRSAITITNNEISRINSGQ